VLPDEPAHVERFQWLVQQVRDDGGEATLARVTNIEDSPTTISPVFLTKPCAGLRRAHQAANELIAANRRKPGEGFAERGGENAATVPGSARD